MPAYILDFDIMTRLSKLSDAGLASELALIHKYRNGVAWNWRKAIVVEYKMMLDQVLDDANFKLAHYRQESARRKAAAKAARRKAARRKAARRKAAAKSAAE